jgi:hypothetical protein
MFASQMILAVTCLAFAGWLHWNERQGWPNESYDRQDDEVYLNRRMRSRRRVHALFALCGLLIATAAIAGPGRIFIAAWLTVSLVLMTVVLLAALDALRTSRYDKRKTDELRKRLFNEGDS